MRNYTLSRCLLILGCLWYSNVLSGAIVPMLTELRTCFAAADENAFANTHRRYTQSGKLETQRMLVRFRQVEPILDKLLLEANAPQWLKYTPLAESRLKLTAISSAGAAGIWQIMPRTGRSLGLRINYAVDERLDLIRSTQAAVTYLLQLHDTFDDWLLALAAYNCGASNVRKAQRRAGAYDYAAIRNYLPTQTRLYLPRIFTIANIAANPDCYGIEEVPIDPLQPVLLKASTSLREVAQCLGVSLRTLSKWNPSFRNGVVHVREESVVLWLPMDVLKALPPRAHIWQLANRLHRPQLFTRLPFSVVGIEVV